MNTGRVVLFYGSLAYMDDVGNLGVNSIYIFVNGYTYAYMYALCMRYECIYECMYAFCMQRRMHM
jgi:hypothetical protein